MQKLDLWLRSVWAFWDTHGTRLLGVVTVIHNAIAAVLSALGDITGPAATVWFTINAVLGALTKARGSTNAQRTQ